MRRLLKKVLRPEVASQEPVIPSVDCSTLLAPRDFSLTMLEPQVVDGNVSAYELFIINSLVAQRAPRMIFEFGTFNGRTALNLAANSPEGARVFTLDLPKTELHRATYELQPIEKKFVDKASSGDLFKDRPEASKITQLFGDSAEFDYAPFLGTMDFVFVDASHSYEYVLNDSRIALRLLRSGQGTILWHDYGRPHWWPGVTGALNELKDEAPFQHLLHIEGTSLACLTNA